MSAIGRWRRYRPASVYLAGAAIATSIELEAAERNEARMRRVAQSASSARGRLRARQFRLRESVALNRRHYPENRRFSRRLEARLFP